MIATIIDSIDGVVSGRFPTHTRFGLVEQWPTNDGVRPFKISAGQGVPVLEDINGNLSYWRLTGKIQQSRTEQCDEVVWGIPLRLAYLLDATSDQCASVPDAMLEVMLSIGAMERAVETDVPGSSVRVVSMGSEVGTIRAIAAEAPGIIPPPQKAFVYVDISLTVQGTTECLTQCN